MAFFPLGPAYGGIIRRFPAAAYSQYASPQIPPGRDAALPSEKIHIYELDTDDVTTYLWMNAVYVLF